MSRGKHIHTNRAESNGKHSHREVCKEECAERKSESENYSYCALNYRVSRERFFLCAEPEVAYEEYKK